MRYVVFGNRFVFRKIARRIRFAESENVNFVFAVCVAEIIRPVSPSVGRNVAVIFVHAVNDERAARKVVGKSLPVTDFFAIFYIKTLFSRRKFGKNEFIRFDFTLSALG